MTTTCLARTHRVCTCTLVVLTLCAPAWAQPGPDITPPAPSSDLSDILPIDPPQRAAALFGEGTALFKQWRFDEAEEKYREALTHWEHPIIQLYLSRTLDKQLRLVEAHATLQQALRRGRTLLSPEDIQVAEVLQQSLESRLAQIEVHCDVPGAEVSLDGQPWFTAPGRQRRMIGAGLHVLIARKPGYFPVTEPVSLIPGKQTRIVLRMTADAVHVERRWQTWRPWAVAGTGIAVSLAGGLFWWQARSDYTAFENAVSGCQEAICARVPTRRRDIGERNDALGSTALITGSAVLAAGLAGVLINQPSTRRSEPSGREVEIDLAPLVSGDTVGISAHIEF
jgi:hypothetical protein